MRLPFGYRTDLPAEMFSHYWQSWLPYAVAAVLLAVLAALAAVNAAGIRMIAPAGMFAIAAGGLALLGGSAAALADAAAEGDGLTVFDRPVWRWFVEHRSPAATTVAKIVTEVGSTVTMTVIASVVTIVCWWRNRRGDAVLTAVIGLGAGLIVFVGKRAVGRQRPPAEFRLADETNLSFPSGHSLASMAVLGGCTVLLVAGIRPLAGRIAIVCAAVLAVASIGVSRLYLGVHWATDVLGGWLTGAAWLLLCVVVRRLWRSYTDNADRGRPTHTDPGTTDAPDDAGDSPDDGSPVGRGPGHPA